MSLGGERGSVQNPFIAYAESAGWTYVPKEKAIEWREGTTSTLFKEIFLDQLCNLNPDFIDRDIATELAKRIERVPPTIQGNLVVWEHLKGTRTIFDPVEKRERNVLFINTDQPFQNTFHITDEFTFTNGSKTIRADIVFLVNGIPVFLVETKAAHKTEGIAEALDQVRRYHRECPELLAILQVYAVTHIIRYLYSATWNTSVKSLFNWKTELGSTYEELVRSFCDRTRFISLLTSGILFTQQDDELKKVILRPHQLRAAEKLVARAADPVKTRALVWHTQGSGKTYTMIVAAQLILENPIFENPTVIMLVDRNELETQLFGNLTATGMERVEVARSKAHLQDILASDYRGLVVTMIHKFDGMPENITDRNNIFVLVDEAHRTTGGKLGTYLMGALPNATYLGFTGTPIDRTAYGQGTFIVFGRDDPPKGYLDKYGIAESIADGTTVPLHYTLAPNELRVDRVTLEKEFWSLAEAEGCSDVEELNKVLERAVNLRNMMKNRDRVEEVGHFIARHFQTTIEPMGYKAFVVAVDREACALYKKEIDRYLPPDNSEVIYSPGPSDDEDLQAYYHADEEEKRIRKAFRNPESLPKILIVTEKLLTGFDAPILYCMYLDKPMRDHVLLQAIARVNRPYEDSHGARKPAGFVLDIVGIFDKLQKALAFDSSDIKGIVEDLDILKHRMKELLVDARAKYVTLVQGKSRDKAVETILLAFMDEEKRHEFYRFFREVSDIYEILSPDPFLRPYIDDIETLARMYRMLKENFEPGVLIDRDFSRKTAQLVQEHTQSTALMEPAEIYEIDRDTLQVIEEKQSSDIEKVFNLLKSIRKTVENHTGQSPYLIPISERAEAIITLYRNRQKTTQQTLDELKKLIREIQAARREQEERQMTVEEFSIFWLLKKNKVDRPEEKASSMKDVLALYPHWRQSEEQKRAVKQEFYKVLMQAGMRDVKELKRITDYLMIVVERASRD